MESGSNGSGGGGLSGLTKWLLLGAGVFVFFQFVWPRISGKGGAESDRQPLTINDSIAPETRKDEAFCALTSDRFTASFSTRGASARSVRMTQVKYAKHVEESNTRTDLVTTSLESRMPLRTDLRDPLLEGEQQVAFDDLDYDLTEHSDSACTFVHKDDHVEIKKELSLTGRPFEIDIKLTVTNLADKPLKHRLTVEQSAWRTKTETSGHLGRLPEYETQTDLHSKTKTERLRPDAFEPKDFADKEFTAEKWYRVEGDAMWAATNSSYFSSAVVPRKSATPPHAEALIEDRWNASRYPKKDDDPDFGHVYRTRLAYPTTELGPNESASYEALAFMGPKERDVVSSIGGDGDAHETSGLINMSVFLFGSLFASTLGKWLVGYVYWLHTFTGSWGFAIILLTVSVKIAVFPLSLFGLNNMVGMRRIKPMLDEVNKKHKDQMMERNAATQEIMRREKVGSPIMGCIPALLQMPIWFTLYSALRTSVELYHTSFGPLIPDLAEPGKYFVIPVILGASSFLQQKLMQANMPAADPQQQKMMLYMMPLFFTVMNVFLPAGLGVYMLTNTWLGIIQQVLVERWIQKKLRDGSGGGPGTIQVRDKSEGASSLLAAKAASATLGKGKARARG